MNTKFNIFDLWAFWSPFRTLSRANRLQREKKFVRAFKLFSVAAQAGITEGESAVGQHYLTGEGVSRNTREAARWLTRAAIKGHIGSQRLLAGLYVSGLRTDDVCQPWTALFAESQNTEIDFGAALRWGLLAAEAGDRDAQATVGYVYLSKAEPFRDLDKARFWYEQSAIGGSPQGHLGFGLICLREAAGHTEAILAAIGHIKEAAAANLACSSKRER